MADEVNGEAHLLQERSDFQRRIEPDVPDMAECLQFFEGIVQIVGRLPLHREVPPSPQRGQVRCGEQQRPLRPQHAVDLPKREDGVDSQMLEDFVEDDHVDRIVGERQRLLLEVHLLHGQALPTADALEPVRGQIQSTDRIAGPRQCNREDRGARPEFHHGRVPGGEPFDQLQVERKADFMVLCVALVPRGKHRRRRCRAGHRDGGLDGDDVSRIGACSPPRGKGCPLWLKTGHFLP